MGLLTFVHVCLCVCVEKTLVLVIKSNDLQIHYSTPTRIPCVDPVTRDG